MLELNIHTLKNRSQITDEFHKKCTWVSKYNKLKFHVPRFGFTNVLMVLCGSVSNPGRSLGTRKVSTIYRCNSPLYLQKVARTDGLSTSCMDHLKGHQCQHGEGNLSFSSPLPSSRGTTFPSINPNPTQPMQKCTVQYQTHTQLLLRSFLQNLQGNFRICGCSNLQQKFRCSLLWQPTHGVIVIDASLLFSPWKPKKILGKG